MISPIIRNKIVERYGKEIRYSKDCEGLALDISCKVDRRISTSTVRRLFGFVQGCIPRQYTLDVLAEYIGFGSYDEFIGQFDPTTTGDRLTSVLVVAELTKGQQVRLCYEHHVLELGYLGSEKFQVVSSTDCYVPGDGISFGQVVLHQPLFVKAEQHNKTSSIVKIVLGKVSGITRIDVEKDSAGNQEKRR